MTRRRRALLLTACLAAVAVPLGGSPAGAAGELKYSVAEARTYVYRVALRKEVIEVAQNADPCDPKEDPYECDDAAYNERPNCGPKIALGRTEDEPKAAPASETQAIEGAAGDGSGAEEEPPLSSAITLNEMVSLGSLVHNGPVLEAAGMASDGYVDLSGRQDPELHTESDAFTPNKPDYGERCLQEERGSDDYRHFLSRSFDRPETYHLSECRGDECTFDRLAFFAQAKEARTVVHLVERGGEVRGWLKANLQEFSWGGGAFTVDELDTFVTFASDGTRQGLTWSVSSTAQGAELGGRPVALPPGRIVGNDQLQVGVAAPYVTTSKDGADLRIVAPGLTIASQEQTVHLAGAELDVGGMGLRSADPSFGDLPTGAGDGTTTTTTTTGTTTPSSPATDTGSGEVAAAPSGDADQGEAPAPQAAVSVQRIGRTGLAPMLTILALGLIGTLAVLMRWMGRFAWWREAVRVQPLRGIDWIYRAFLKT